jgi:predicted kinase
MKYVLTLESFLKEGINDPGILKAFFMAGGPGSGKSYVASELFDFPKGTISSVSYATGLKLVNSDNAFEKMMRDSGIDQSKLGEYANDPEKWAEIMAIRNKAKGITKRMQDNYIGGRLGQVIDGTGKDYAKIKGNRELYNDLGYDTYMVFVNTSLEVALERNAKRERSVPEDLVKKMWQEVQSNMGKFQNLFGTDKMLIIDNSSYDNMDTMNKVERQIMKYLKTPVENPLGKLWLRENDPKTARYNQPF